MTMTTYNNDETRNYKNDYLFYINVQQEMVDPLTTEQRIKNIFPPFCFLLSSFVINVVDVKHVSFKIRAPSQHLPPPLSNLLLEVNIWNERNCFSI